MQYQSYQLPEYNGWTNKPTWIVYMWLSNEQYLYEIIRGMGAEEIKEFVEENADEILLNANMFTDLLGWALAHVDWNEIAEAANEE